MDVDDLTTLPELSLKIILETVTNRFKRNCIFTNVSEIVVSVNPFQYLEEVLGEELIRRFHLDKPQADISAYPPHLYSLARAAYRGAVGAGPHPAKNQSVLISGESGAGKTEATKLCLRYFASMSATRGGTTDEKQIFKAVSEEEDSLEHKLMNANPIMEALGNAKTIRNDNSSRFGKWISLQLNGKGVIVGGSITKYLLEESRVVNVGPGERNYHIFYQMCKKFGTEATKFRYLDSNCAESSGVDDAQDYETVMDALRSIGMSHEDREILCHVVWGILHLGEIKFEKAGAESLLAKDDATLKALKLTSDLLVGPQREEAFTRLLLKQVVHAGHETVVAHRTEEQARTTRDSIAKMLYARLFDYTVWRINNAIEVTQHSGSRVATSIGILDIFGFESFQVNSFEQLCINYANEKLQLFFIDYLTTTELNLYKTEGLDVAKMPHSFTNNQSCVDLLEKPNGVFSLISDEVRSRTGNDAEFLSKLYREHSKHSCFERPRVGGKDVFSIKHYAQMVEYTVHGFIDKNKSKVGEDVTAFFSQSQLPMVQTMINLEAPAAAGTNSTGSTARRMTTPSRGDPASSRTKIASLGQAFKAQLSDLVVSIAATKAHFIRCIKPNSERLPGVLDEKMVERQLLTSGMVDAVTIRQIGYSDRLSYPLFLRRYASLVSSYFTPRATKLAWQKVLDASEQDQVRTILQLLPATTLKHWQLGKTKVFYRLPVLMELEKSRELIRNNAVIAFQRRARGCQARRYYQDLSQVWQELTEHVARKDWDKFAEAVEEAKEMGFSEAQLRDFCSEWKDAISLRRAAMNLVQALSFATMPTLPPNKWFRDRVAGLESAAEQVRAVKMRPNQALLQLITMTEELHVLLSGLWSVCTTQQMDASTGPARAKNTIFTSCRDASIQRNTLCIGLPLLLRQLDLTGVEANALLSHHKSPIESFPEIQSLYVRIDALDDHFKASVKKLEASLTTTRNADAKTLRSVLLVLNEKELGIPLEYFPDGLEALREPLVQRLAMFEAEELAREQAEEELRAEELRAQEAAAAAAAAKAASSPLLDPVFKPKLAGNRRKPQQVKSFPPTGPLGDTASFVDSASFVEGASFVDTASFLDAIPAAASFPGTSPLLVEAISLPELVPSISEPPNPPSNLIANPPQINVAAATTVSLEIPTPRSPAALSVHADDSVSKNSLSDNEGKDHSDSEDDSVARMENLSTFASLLPVFHGLGTRLNWSTLPGPGVLRVMVHNCANLIFFASNFYVSLTYHHAKKTDKGVVSRTKKKRTSVIRKGAKILTWDENLEFTSRDPSLDWIRVAVKEKESRSKSKCLGEIRFKVAEIALMSSNLLGNRVGNSHLHRVWQLRGSVQGEITLTFSFAENCRAKDQAKKEREKRAKNRRIG